MTAFGLQCVYGGVISDLRGTVQQGDGWREAVSREEKGVTGNALIKGGAE